MDNLIDVAIVLAFVAYSIYVGFASRREASKNLTEYFLAGRTIRGWRAGLSMAATQFAADTPLLVMGLLAIGGVFSLWRLWIYALAFLLMGFVLGACWRRAGVLTDAELTMIRYSAKGALTLRVLKAFYYGTVINCVIMAFVLVAAARIFELFLPWHDWLPASFYDFLLAGVGATGLEITSGVTGLTPDIATTNNVISIVLTLAFVAVYSTTGGLRSVIRTDVVQLVLMLAGTLGYAIVAINAAGGRSGMLASLDSLYGAERAGRMLSFTPTGEDLLMPFLVVLALQWFFQINSDGTGYLAQRTMACRSDRQARIAAVTFTITQIIVRSLMWLAIGIALLVIYPLEASPPFTEEVIAQRETLFALGITELLPAGLRGLMITAMLAALASTLDTHLNWGAGYWSNDIYKALWVEKIRGREAGPRELVLVARLSNVLILVIAVTIMTQLGSIQTAWQISLLFGAGVGAVLVLRWLWEHINLYCEIAAMLTSLVLAPPLILFVEQGWLRLLIMSLTSLVVIIATALLTPPTETHRLEAFYRRTQPPGWWRQTAARAGDEPGAPLSRMRADSVYVVSAAASVFCWLVGLGKLLLQPDATFGAVLLLAGGSLAVPLWWPALRRDGEDDVPANAPD